MATINRVTVAATQSSIDVAIVGGGAAGLATAIFVARRVPGRAIVVFDGAKKLGAKILVAGGGRCNVTNRVVTAADFCGGSRNFIKRVLAAHSSGETVSFFREIGVELVAEEHGKLFPVTNRAQTVLDALLAEANRCAVSIRPAHRVTDIHQSGDAFQIETGAATIFARHVVLATGGQSLPKTGSDGVGFRFARALGHTLVPLTPALVPLVLEGGFHAPLSGVAHDVELTVSAAHAKDIRLSGALLWTHFGISGPVVLDASRHWHRARAEGRDVNVSLNLLPGRDFATADRLLLDLTATTPNTRLQRALGRFLPARVAQAVLGKLAIDGSTSMAHLHKDQRRVLVHGLLSWPLPVRDSRGYAYAEATAGGLLLSEIDPASMASRKCPGLFLVGEILDVDGRIGGFNFQWAWSSAWVAAMGVSRSIRPEREYEAN
ncbi:MAG: NAD(P)/FAD-dependent oxidoreductase [Planctomycetes bacterium]|nr:NAD(P)/FAD-dependent oxidoreductase [Planctomycetota bacterium]